MMLVTALATAFLNLLIIRTGLYGASGIAFMMILLSSFTNIRQREIPITFILIVVLYVGREVINAFTPDQVSQLAHIAGGIIGGLFGFLFSKHEAVPAKAPTTAASPAPAGPAKPAAGTTAAGTQTKEKP
jgi:membrane associated rhomboid family serine protease